MTYREAKDAIINLIRSRVSMLNLLVKNVNPEKQLVESFRKEIRGMLFCLKSISPANECWCVNYLNDFTEFGYYDDNDEWHSVEK